MIEREGWEVKKLKTLCDIFIDGDWIETKDQSEEGIRLIQTGNIGIGFFENKEKNSRYISEETFNNLNCTEIFEGDCLLSRLPSPIGRACIIPNINQRMITSVDCTILRFKDGFLKRFFVYYSQSNLYQQDIEKYSTGSTRKRISRGNLSKIKIPIPPLPIQHQIVAELDTLNAILDKKREQLAELDNLAQATFYDMFGDPIDNEKGWEVKKLGEVFLLKSGKSLSAKNIIKGEYPVFGGNGVVGYHNEFNLNGLHIIIGRVGALCGNVRLINDKIWLTDNGFDLIIKYDSFNYKFLEALLSLLNLRSYAREALQPVISNTTLKKINIIIPPLSLQTQFATKIEHLEKQKELIERSIVDVQQLYDYTMDKYFG